MKNILFETSQQEKTQEENTECDNTKQEKELGP